MKTNSLQTRAKASVYAEVLLEAAKASGKVFDITGDFGELLSIVRGSLELRKTLTDKAISAEDKKALIVEIFKQFSPELLTMFGVMVERQDLSLLSRVYENYAACAEEALNTVFIDVTTVVPLDDELRQQIITKYSSELGRGVMLREHLDPSLLGGIVLSTHGKRIDASVSSQLENARHVLSKTQ
jgi:F-type H+-transporting ATPase subunit delta